GRGDSMAAKHIAHRLVLEDLASKFALIKQKLPDEPIHCDRTKIVQRPPGEAATVTAAIRLVGMTLTLAHMPAAIEVQIADDAPGILRGSDQLGDRMGLRPRPYLGI